MKFLSWDIVAMGLMAVGGIFVTAISIVAFVCVGAFILLNRNRDENHG